MKVLLISQIARVDYKYTFSLANALRKCGNDVELVIDDKTDNDYCLCECHNKFLTSRKDIGKIQKVINYIDAYRYILKKIKKEKFDVLHVQWFQLSPVDYYFLKKAKKAGIKIVVSIHDILPFNEKWYDKFFHARIYKLCDHIIVQAEKNVERFNSLFSTEKDKVTYIPHGHFLEFADCYSKSEMHKKFDIPEDMFVLLFFGQIKTVKGLGVLIEAFGHLCKKKKKVYLVVAGSVWKDDFEPYQKIIDKYNLTKANIKKDIRFIEDEEIGYYYSLCDIAVLPYLDVYQSGVVQLAYAYEKPVIATNLDAFKDIVQEGKTGFVCEPNNVESLILAMERAIDNKEHLRSMGKRGKENIDHKFSWEKIARCITQLYIK